jgi:hypothetical protein
MVATSEFVQCRAEHGIFGGPAADAGYLLLAEGTNEQGAPCREKPQRLLPDGKPYPVENMPGLTCVMTESEHDSRRSEKGRRLGRRRRHRVLADDAKTMVATTSGFDSQLRQFKMHTVWDRL